MKKLKKFIPIIITVAILLTVELSTGLISSFFRILPSQFSSEAYIRFIENIDYDKSLEESPLCVNDKMGDGTEYSKTELSAITERRELHEELYEEYKLDTIATADSDFEKSLQLISWLTENTYYSGVRLKSVNDNSVDMLKSSFGKSIFSALNCRNKAIVFADCLVAVGVKAYPVCMLSMNNGCHFTCRVYISELDKWCAFDPSFGCWFSDANGTPLDIFELRELFLQGGEPTVNNYNFNGTDRALHEYITGFLKGCMSNLSTWDNNSENGRDEVLGKNFKSSIPD